MPRAALLIANWKMYKTVEESASFARLLRTQVEVHLDPRVVDLVVAPTALALATMSRQLGSSPIKLAAQNLEPGTEGALTGALSGYLLAEAGAHYVIVGHSERRHHFGETDAMVADKVDAAWNAGLVPIVCIGETEAERDLGHTEAVLERQLAAILAKPFNPVGLVIAYEPVWAIGTGRVAEAPEVGRIAHKIRQWLDSAPDMVANVPILYGGSVNANNLTGFLRLADVDGALIGGASLSLEGLAAMVAAAVSLAAGDGQ